MSRIWNRNNRSSPQTSDSEEGPERPSSCVRSAREGVDGRRPTRTREGRTSPAPPSATRRRSIAADRRRPSPAPTPTASAIDAPTAARRRRPSAIWRRRPSTGRILSEDSSSSSSSPFFLLRHMQPSSTRLLLLLLHPFTITDTKYCRWTLWINTRPDESRTTG